MKLALSRKNLWERMPPAGRTAVGAVLGKIPLQYLLGAKFRQTLDFVEDAQWWPSEKARKYQLGELQRICKLAYEKTAYYKRTFSEAGFHPNDLKKVEDLRGLPIIGKQAIQDNLEEMLAEAVTGSDVDYITTGGTTGEPLRFYIQAGRSAVEFAYLVSSWKRAGYNLDKPLAVFRGRMVSKDRNGFPHSFDPLLRQHYYSTFHMTEENLGKYMEHVRQLGLCYLHAYPSTAATLARFLKRNGLERPTNIMGILAESENVYPEQRAFVENAFGCKYFSSYGHTEKLIAAAECEHSADYHVWPTYGFFELVDEEGNPVKTPGQSGEITGTGFINSIVPFIRYRTGDFATYVGEKCKKCGREQTIIADIRGHNIQEHLVAADGSMIPWSSMNMHDDTFDNILKIQFRQETPGEAVLRLIAAPSFKQEEEARIRANMEKKLGDRIKFKLEFTDRIDASRSGKAIYVDQRMSAAVVQDD